ncbi:RNA-binding cell elongation regulator Jag/EloR [Paenibacillus beijingensis]|uniref:RNA-binding protein KhpB n=1 Tax=Paenibacillus beijingensis TaxID=1126833 RepID=A0A0D5NIE2_9BACL|nr:RNA-binding cell elongation regulator Jag/EloR [Paenibacillus beijingensis]AJY74890.1 DNA-binding protein [Paenibacillus beijingensis]
MRIVASGKTVEDAVRTGLAQLGTSEDRVKMSVLEQPSKGLFGLFGVRKATVEMELLPQPPDALEEAQQFLLRVAEAMGITVQVELRKSREGQLLLLSGDKIGKMIGRRGAALDALQYLANIVANRYSDSRLRIILDAEDFRERRRQTLAELSHRIAGRVIRTGKEVVLEAMSAQERKVIHAQLQNHPKVKTYSKGDEPNRRVVVTLK